MRKWMVVLLTAGCLVFMAVSAWAGTAKGLFIYWRGPTDCAAGLKAGLSDLGVAYEADEFDAQQDKEKLVAFLSQLDASQYDFIYTFGTTVSLKAAEKVADTPIVFGIVTTPVKSGLIESWDAPGRKITGISHAVSYKDQVDFILGLSEFSRIGMIYNPGEKNSGIAKDELSAQFSERNVAFIAEGVSTPDQIGDAVASLVKQKVEMVYLPSDSFIASHAGAIVEALNANGIPTYGALEKLVRSGAMIGIVSSYRAVGRELAGKVEEILGGRDAAEMPSYILPVEMQQILLNAKTAEAVGMELPYALISNATLIE